jgi:outer membrane lipoprotein-sorting protein
MGLRDTNLHKAPPFLHKNAFESKRSLQTLTIFNVPMRVQAQALLSQRKIIDPNPKHRYKKPPYFKKGITMRFALFFLSVSLMVTSAPAVVTVPEAALSPSANNRPLINMTTTPEARPLEANSSKLVPATLTSQDKKHIARIETYLDKIKSITAKFSQVSPDGGVSYGAFYLQRPGKLRMEYEQPTPVLVMTSGENIIYFDKELDQVTNISLDSTLVGFLTRNKIRFDNTVTIAFFERGEKSLRVALVQSARPQDGMMTLEFSDEPLILRNIIMTDSAAQSTVVSLANARFDEALDPALFVFKDPRIAGDRHIKK